MAHVPADSAAPAARRPSRGAVGRGVLFVAVAGYGVFLHTRDIDSRPFTVDEAESSINALTILQCGVPVDRYLGLPLYENTLTRPWPDSPEYEFKDSSYSDRGLAVYHGWLPLYATAAAFGVAGVRPDDDPEVRGVKHSVGEVRRRTAVARVPAAVFGAGFLVAVFLAAREWYGPDAGWAALAAAAVAEPVVYFSQQARYYSATLALTAACAWLTARVVRRGRWRDYLLAAVGFVLLFHTHVLSFVAALTLAAAAAWRLRRAPGAAVRLAVSAAVVAAGVVPWVVLTGFATAARDIPPARELLGVEDVAAFLRKLGPVSVAAALAVAWVLANRVFRGRLPGRLAGPFAGRAGAFVLLAGWAVAGLLAFVLLVPAASYFHGRLVLTVFVPAFLFGASFCAAAARVVAPRAPAPLAAGLMVLGLAAAGQARFTGRADAPAHPFPFEVVDHLRGMAIRPGTRVYATPNHHLILTFYTGMPVQSAAPVRKSFFDRYGGELLIVEAGPRYEPLTGDEIRRALEDAGTPVPASTAEDLERLLPALSARHAVRPRVASVTPPDQAPAFLDVLVSRQQRKTREGLAARSENEGNPLLKGFHLPDRCAWWQVYYYRFVGPDGRMVDNLNYADRIKESHADVLGSGWVLYSCPPRN